MGKLIFIVGFLVMLNCHPKQKIGKNPINIQFMPGQSASYSAGNFIIPYIPYEVPEYDISWHIVEVDSNNLGSENCKHVWKYSKEWRAGGNMGCGVYHAGRHCSYDDMMRNRICSKCLRHETQRENWVEKEKPPRKLTPYEKLEKKLRGG